MHSHARRCLVAFAFAALAGGARAADPTPPKPKAVTAAVRARVDRLALSRPLEAPALEAVNLAGNVPAWLLSQVHLTPEEELAHARAVHKELRARHRTAAAPPAARRALARLVAQLPPHLKPSAFTYTLTVLDKPRHDAFTPGGGLLYVTRPLLDDLLGAGERGEGALAFVLARELGHVAYLHCRRGWQLLEVEEEIKKGVAGKLDARKLRAALETGVRTSGNLVWFLYSRDQEYEADLFALHLCRNAGVALDPALDAVRLGVLARHPRLLTDAAYIPALDRPATALGYYLSAQPDLLLRLKRLLQERDGRVEGEEEFGLFAYDREEGTFTRCADGAVKGGARPVVFIHGLRGGLHSLRAYFAAFAPCRELRGRPLLAFRWPGNSSLARSGRFLSREVARVVKDPKEAVFICNSAGGLVFRHYAEKGEGGFDRAVLLATPHGGSDLTGLKFLVDLADFTRDLGGGLSGAIAAAVPEGRGEITHDLHPDSLFLRHLGHDPRLAKRYHVFYGHYLTGLRALALSGAFAAGRKALESQAVPLLPSPRLRRGARRVAAGLVVPEEVARGDLVVSAASAKLKGAGRTTKTALHHQAFKTDPALIRQVFEAITDR